MTKARRIALIVLAVLLVSSVVALAACTDPTEGLAEAKAKALAELEEYYETKLEGWEYTAENAAALEAAYNAGVASINGAEKTAEVDKLLKDAKASLDAIEGVQLVPHTLTYYVGETVFATQTVYETKKASKTKKVPDPTETQVFHYWSLTNGGEEYDWDTIVTGDFSLHAVFRDKLTYTVKLFTELTYQQTGAEPWHTFTVKELDAIGEIEETAPEIEDRALEGYRAYTGTSLSSLIDTKTQVLNPSTMLILTGAPASTDPLTVTELKLVASYYRTNISAVSGKYTYNDFTSGGPNTWNVHTWETNEDSYIIGFTEMGLYDVALNETKDGYVFVPEMAAAKPIDVTAQYVGEKWGITSADKNRAFKIALNPKAVWENGEPINADTYIYSMQELLNPKMLNRRADSYYAGDLVLANAYNYLYSGKTVLTPVDVEKEGLSGKWDSLTAAQKGALTFSISNSEWAAYLKDNGYDLDYYFAAAFGIDVKPLDGKTLAQIEADEDLKAILAETLEAWCTDPDEEFGFFCSTVVMPVTEWDEVGLLKTGEYEIVIILEKAIDPEFDLLYNLAGNWIVYKELYEQCKRPAATEDGLITSTYGTSKETYISYGPYKLDEYQQDKYIHMTKNDKWYGWTDGEHEGQFMTTDISCQIIEKHSTALQMFLKGLVDNIGLTSDDMEKYRGSEYLSVTPESYTSKLTFNTSKAALKDRESEGVNKTLLAYTDFRAALSFGLSRSDFTQQNTASHRPGYGLLNYMYCYDPVLGKLYRETAAAKEALVKLYVGEDWAERYDSLDEAYEALDVNAYDLTYARELLAKAIAAAKEAGDYKAGDTVELDFAFYANDDAYVKMYNWFQAAVDKLVEGTELEGKLKLNMIVDPDYYDSMAAGKLDIIISTWGGAAFAPFGVLSNCYVDDPWGGGQQMEYGFDTSKISVTITYNNGEEDVTETHSLKDWADGLNGKFGTDNKDDLRKLTNLSNEQKVVILAALEYAHLKEFATIPLYYRYSAGLDSHRIKPGTDSYLQLIGYGGIRHMTYTMDDAQWSAYVKENTAGGKDLQY